MLENKVLLPRTSLHTNTIMVKFMVAFGDVDNCENFMSHQEGMVIAKKVTQQAPATTEFIGLASILVGNIEEVSPTSIIIDIGADRETE